MYIKDGEGDFKRSALAIKYCLVPIFMWSLFSPLAQLLYTLVLEDKICLPVFALLNAPL